MAVRSRALSDLRADVVFEADLPTPSTTTHITTQNLTDLINAGIAEMFNIVVSEVGDDVYRKTGFITTDGSSTVFDLATDLFKLTEVTLLVGSDYINLTRITPQERAFLKSASPAWDGTPYKYDVVGKTGVKTTSSGQIEILPLATSGQTVLYYYVPAPDLLSADADALDGFAGFEDYAVLFAAMRCQMRRGMSEEAGNLRGELQRVRDNIIAGMKTRDMVHPPKTQIIRNNEDWRSGRRWIR